jgi:hypothetical protein
MKREIVQDFLNLPGIVGLALMDGRSRPYFYGIDRSLDFQQKEALTQGIQQVIDTTPADFDCFQFQFSGHQVYIHKLNHGIILLVLAVASLVNATYTQLVDQLKLELQQDVANTIATFRLLAGNVTLSGQTDWKQGIETIPTPIDPQPVATDSTATIALPPPLSSPPSSLQPIAVAPPAPFTVPPPAAQTNAAPSVKLKEVLAAMNHLSQYATHYLGPRVVANYWKTTRPPVEWLTLFQVERSSQLSAPDQQTPLTAEQHQWLQDWVAAFVERCTKVIRDFPKTIQQTVLDDRQKFLLFPPSP